MTVAELIAEVDEQIVQLQVAIETYDERAAIQQAELNGKTTTQLAIAALQRPERFSGEHAVARTWLRHYAPHTCVFIRHGQ